MSAVESLPPERFEDLFQRVAPALYAQACALLGGRAGAEDLVQEAFVRVWRQRARLREPERLEGYLATAVRNLAFDQLRRRQTRARGDLLAARPERIEEPHRPDLERIDAALRELPPEQREVVVLRVQAGLPFAEVALRTGAPLGTVHSRYRYALTRLRELLRPLDPERVGGAEGAAS